VMLSMPDRPQDSLRGEHDRLCWLREALAKAGGADLSITTPRVLAFTEVDQPAGRWSYLLTTGIPGDPLHHAFDETPIRCGRLMGKALRVLHDLDPSGSPQWLGLDELLDMAAANVETGRLPSSIQPNAMSAKQMKKQLKWLRKKVPADVDAVVCHGDFCLPNVLAGLDDAVGLVDVGDAAVCDRHLDVAQAIRSLRFNGGHDDVVRVFLNWYGPDRVDEQKLEWFTKLLELI
ncbi:MAG: phosphotransferase, partial [Planctomycetota bacterium]